MLINFSISAAAVGGFTLGWNLRSAWSQRMRGGNLGAQRLIWSEGHSTPSDWRCSFNHENHNAPPGPPPLKLQRSKPQF